MVSTRKRAKDARISDAFLVPVDGELLKAVRQARQRLADVGPERERVDGDYVLVGLPRTDGDALRDLVITERARVVIEIGLAYGGSALAIGEALVSLGLPETWHLIVDAYQDQFEDAGWNEIVKAGLGEPLHARARAIAAGAPRPPGDRGCGRRCRLRGRQPHFP